MKIADDAERVVAGTALLGADEFDSLASTVSLDDFQQPAARIVFEIAAKLRAEDANIDAAAVLIRARQSEQFRDLGTNPAAFLGELIDLAGVGANGQQAARTVREASIRRQFARLCAEGLRDANEPCDVDDLLSRFSQQAQAIADGRSGTSGPVSMATAFADALRRMDTIASGNEPLIPTPVSDLNDFLAGGLRPGELHILAARTSVGKSALALRIAEHAASHGSPTLFFSLEMSTGELTQRSIAAAAAVPLSVIRTAKPSADDVERINREGEPGGVAQLDLHIDDRSGLTASQVSLTVRRMARRHGIRFVVVDYVQLLRPEDSKAPRYQQIGESAKILKSLAKQCQVSILTLAQLNRASMNDEEPQLHHLRDSGDLEQDADSVWILNRVESDLTQPIHQIDLHVAKNRNGSTGRVELDFVRKYAQFRQRAAKHNW